MKRKVFLTSWVLDLTSVYLFIYLFEKMSSSLNILLVMLFIYVGKRLNSRSQMFLKILQYSQENTCLGVSF